MPHLPYPADSQLKPEASEVLKSWEAAYGRPSHILRLLSWNSRFVRTAFDAWHQLVVEPGNLPRWVREGIVVITCSTQQTKYCVEGHSHSLRRQGVSDEQVLAIQRRTFEGFKDPEVSIFRFAHKAAGAPKTLAAQDYKALANLGLSEETILEILSVVWANTAMNMIVDALGVERTAEMMKELD
jgi:uncharacterized peroxidase-related enzyme